VSDSPLSITVYGGAPGEIGGNRILLEWARRRWLLDFGMRFGATGRFFEEFVKPRGSTLGLRDYLRMGLLPPIEGLYRSDLIAHEPNLFDRYRDHPHHRRIEHVDGVLLTHGHVDHVGSVGFLREDIPVYTGLMTATICKCLQDPNPSSLDGEFNYFTPREAKGDVLGPAKTGHRVQRQYYVAETDPALLEAMERLR